MRERERERTQAIRDLLDYLRVELSGRVDPVALRRYFHLDIPPLVPRNEVEGSDEFYFQGRPFRDLMTPVTTISAADADEAFTYQVFNKFKPDMLESAGASPATESLARFSRGTIERFIFCMGYQKNWTLEMDFDKTLMASHPLVEFGIRDGQIICTHGEYLESQEYAIDWTLLTEGWSRKTRDKAVAALIYKATTRAPHVMHLVAVLAEAYPNNLATFAPWAMGRPKKIDEEKVRRLVMSESNLYQKLHTMLVPRFLSRRAFNMNIAPTSRWGEYTSLAMREKIWARLEQLGIIDNDK